MQDLSIDIKTMPQAFGGYHLLLVITCDQTNFTIAIPLRDRTAQTIAEALIYRVIYLFGPPRQIISDEATKFTSAIIQAILCMLNCRLKVISPYNHGSSKCERPEYGTIYQHKGMLLQNLHRRYLYITIKIPHLSDLEQRIPDFPNCDNYGSLHPSNPDPLLNETPTNDNELHQVICNTFKIDYLQEMDIIIKIQNRLECKINYTLPALLPNKMQQGPVTSGEDRRNKRAIPTLAIIQGVAAIGRMMIKGINALVDAKRVSSFNNAIKLINKNVQITHNRLITLENQTAMMAKAIIPVLKDFKQQINNTNDRLYRQYRMMMRAHDRYNRLFRQTHKTFQIHHLALLMIKDYITILLGMLQRIHRQYIRYKSALDDTLIGIEHLNSGYLTHRILEPSTLARYLEAVEDDLEETAPAFEPVFTNVYQYYGNSLISFTNIIDDLLLQLPILIKLKVQVPMSLFSIETAPVPLDAETYLGDKRERVHSDNTGN